MRSPSSMATLSVERKLRPHNLALLDLFNLCWAAFEIDNFQIIGNLVFGPVDSS